MGQSEQWPPLEQVREWAEAKVSSGRVPPAATGKYQSLIALIDEILSSQNSSSASGDSRQSSR
jgi:hypothetical protein